MHGLVLIGFSNYKTVDILLEVIKGKVGKLGKNGKA